MKRLLIIGIGLILVVSAFILITWKQGLWSNTSRRSENTTSLPQTELEQENECWTDGKWMKNGDNFVTDNGCTVCVCQGASRTVFCQPNTANPACVGN